MPRRAANAQGASQDARTWQGTCRCANKHGRCSNAISCLLLPPCPLQAAQWYPIGQLPTLAFDHKLIVRTSFRHLAREGAVQQTPGLEEQLAQAADGLEGPWQEQ